MTESPDIPRAGDHPPGAAPPAAAPSTDPLLLIKGFASLRQLAGIYPTGHPAIAQKVHEIDEIVQRHLREAGSLAIDIIRGDVHLDGIAFRADNSRTAEILAELAAVGVHSIHIRPGVTADELGTVAGFLWDLDASGGAESVEQALARRGVRHVTLGSIVPLDTRWRAMEWADAPADVADPAYAESLDLTEQTFETVRAGRELDLPTVRDLVHLLIDRVASSNAALAQILAVKQYENLTYCHSVNVAIISLLLGRRLQFDDSTTTALAEAALLHDIGKTRVPLEILRKPGALDKLERRLIEMHAAFGAEILVDTPGVGALTATVALEHHRSLKGGGYPDLGAAAVPHLLTQVVAVADVYEAMTGARSYHVPAPPEQACLVLARLAGDRLNTALVRAFVNTVTFFPLGSLVRTTHDEVGVVVRTNPADPLHPVVALLDADAAGGPRHVDTGLRDATGAYRRHIVETLRPKKGELDLRRFFPPDTRLEG